MPDVQVTVSSCHAVACTHPSVVIQQTDGSYATTGYVLGASGVLRADIDALQGLSGSYLSLQDTGLFYPISNPSGFATGIDASNLVAKSETGVYTGLFYPLLSNPSGYLTGQVVRPSETGNFITSSQTGQFYPMSNPSGYATGIDASNLVAKSETGAYTGVFYPLLTNPSGYVTGNVVRPTETGAFLTSIPNDVVRTTGNQTITGDKHFYDAYGYLAIDIGSRYIMNSNGVAYINIDLGQLQTEYQPSSGASLSWLYGQCYDVSGQNSINWMSRQLEGTGGAGDIKVDWTSNILSGVWSSNGAASAPHHLVNYNSLTGYAYPKSSNPSGYITGNVVRPTETGAFLTSSLTGSLTGAFYPLNNNPSGYVTGGVVRPSETGSFITSGTPSGAGTISIFSLDNRLVISGATGAGGGITQSEADLRYYPLETNPSGYTQTGAITGVGTVTTYVSSGILTFSGVPNTGTGAYYPLSSNPSGYVTGQVVRPSDTGFFVTNESTIVRVDTNQAISGAKSFPGSIVDDSSVVSIEPSIRLLSTAGGDYSLDWDSRILYYAGGVPVLSWANTDMRDFADSDSLNWGTRQLFNSSGTNVLDWSAKTLTGGSWLCEDPSVGGAVANYSSVTGYAYPLGSNPSGYVTGSVIRPTDTGAFITSSQTGLFYPRSTNPSGYITGSVVRPSETGNFVTSSQTGQFYPASNPSGYSTGIDSSQFVTLGDAQTITGSKNFDSLLSATGASSEVKFGPYVGGSVSHPFRVTTDGYVQLGDLLGNIELSMEEGIWRYLEVDSIRYRDRELSDASGTPSLLWNDKTLVGRWVNPYIASTSGDVVNYHSLTGFAYPLQSNPSGYATGSVVRPTDTGVFITSSQTGQFYPALSNPSGYVTGSVVRPSETGSFVTTSQTGAFYPTSNPSGFVTNNSTVVRTNTVQTITHPKEFQGGIQDGLGTVVLSPNTQTLKNASGNATLDWNTSILTRDDTTTSLNWESSTLSDVTSNTSIYWSDRLMVDTSDVQSVDWGGRFLLDSAANSSVDYGNRLLYSSSGDQTVNWEDNTLKYLAVTTLDWSGRSLSSGVWSHAFTPSNSGHVVNLGYLTGYAYPMSSNPSGYATGSVVRPTETGTFVTTAQTGVFMTSGTPSGAGTVSIFAQGGRLVISGTTGAGGGLTQGEADALYYPLGTNPSGYVTGSVIRPSDTGQFYPMSNPSGFATGIDGSTFALKSETGAYTGVFYPLNSNPSGYISNSSFTSSVTIYTAFNSL